MGIFKAFEIMDKASLYREDDVPSEYNAIIDEVVKKGEFITDSIDPNEIKYIPISKFVKETHKAIKRRMHFPYGIAFIENDNNMSTTTQIDYSSIIVMFEAYKKEFGDKLEENMIKHLLLSSFNKVTSIVNKYADVRIKEMTTNERNIKATGKSLTKIAIKLIEYISNCKLDEKIPNSLYIEKMLDNYVEERKKNNEIIEFTDNDKEIISSTVEQYKKSNKYEIVLEITKFIYDHVGLNKASEITMFTRILIESFVKYNENLKDKDNSDIIDEVMKILKGGM